MARYGSPDDPGNFPDDEPTRLNDYGSHDYGADPGLPPGEPTPWFRKPVALVSFGAVGAVLIALVVYGLARVITGDFAPATTTTTPLTPLTSTTAPAVVPPATSTASTTTTEPTTTTTTTTEPTTTTTTTTTATTTPSTSVSTSTSTVTQTETQTETVTESPEPPQP